MFSFFLSKNKNKVVFVFLIVLSLSFMSFSSSKFSITFKEVGQTIIYPFRYIVLKVRDGAEAVFSIFTDTKSLKEQLKVKQKLINYYQKRLIALQKDSNNLKELKRLKRLLGYKQNSEYKVDIARIISRDPESNFSSLSLNKGLNDGYRKGMPVIAFQNGKKGVVGIISETSFFTSKVKTFRNNDFSIGAYLPHSDVHGIAQGLGDNQNIMSLLYIDRDSSINLRERVLTSRESRLFPAGINLGYVLSIDTTDKTRLTHKVYLKPFIYLSKIKDVFVILNFNKKIKTEKKEIKTGNN